MTNTNSEYYQNGWDAGYNGDVLSCDYAPGTSAYNDFFAGAEDGANAYLLDEEIAAHEDESWNDDDGLTDAEADAMTLAGAGWGTDEDYGYYGDDYGDY